jgi:tetratricopeptide (TPR) repeat protein
MLTSSIPRQVGSYRVKEVLGQGATGCVYRATLPLMGDQEYAVKLLWERCRPREVSAFLGECGKVKRLGTHPHITLIHFAGRDRRLGRYYVALELVSGPTAGQLAAQAPGHQLPLEEALRVVLHAALALEHAHQRGVIHLDVKPSNILLQADEGIAKITDFGSAMLSREGAMLPAAYPETTTPAYRAWEQTAAGRKAGLRPGERSDVYGLAATLYELLTGHLPAPAEAEQQQPAAHFRADLPQPLETLLARALSRDPERRPATMAEFRQVIEAALAPARVRSALAPPEASDLVGREALLGDLKRRLLGGGNLALSALNGLPGVGKTALARALAADHEVRHHFGDGILWVGLGQRPDVSALLGAWGAALGIPSAELTSLHSSEAQAQVIQSAIGERRILLVIDDAWQVETALLFKLGGPRCAHLVTTRLPEVALRFADAGASVVRVHELSEADGLALLARLAPEAVEREPEEAKALVRLVDGLPLALSLMGNYLRVQAYAGQPRRLRAALDLLRQGKERLRLAQPQARQSLPGGSAPATSPSLMASINASYQALRKQARSMLLALSLFPAKPNDFSEEAAIAVSAASTHTLDALLDAGLLESSGPGRYTMHQTIADFARYKRLSKKPGQRMATFFAGYAQAHQRDYDALERESNNTLVALQFACDEQMPTALIQGASALAPFWEARGLYETAELHLQRAQDAARSLNDRAALTTILSRYGRVLEKLGAYPRAETALQEGLALARQIDQPQGISTVLHALGSIAENRGNYAQAEKYHQEGLGLARQVGQTEQISEILASLARVAFRLGNQSQAEAYYQEGLRLAREIGNRERICGLLQGFGGLEVGRGNYAQGETYWREGLALAREIGHRERTCSLLSNLGGVLFTQERNEEANEYLQEALILAREIGHREKIATVLSNLGGLETTRKRYTEAEVYLREGLAVAREIGNREQICSLLTNLGSVVLYQGDIPQAEGCLKEGLALAREMNYLWYVGSFLCNQGELRLKQERWDDAAAAFREALPIAEEVESQELIATCFYGVAQAAAAQGAMAEARRLGQEGLTRFESIGYYMTAEVRDWLASLPLA